MSDVSTENKIRLLKQIRSRYNEDQFDLSNRERILYGRSSRPAAERYAEPEENGDTDSGQLSFFRLRLVLAVILACLVILMDRKDISLVGITADKIFQAISADYEEQFEQWTFDSQPSI